MLFLFIFIPLIPIYSSVDNCLNRQKNYPQAVHKTVYNRKEK